MYQNYDKLGRGGVGLPFTGGTGKLHNYFFPTNVVQSIPNIPNIKFHIDGFYLYFKLNHPQSV